MARKIGVSVTHRLLPQVEVDIKLDVETMMFEAEFMGKTYADRDGATLRTTIYNLMEEEVIGDKKFVPVISVGLRYDFSVGRFWYKDGVKRNWEQTQTRGDRHPVDIDDLPYLDQRWDVLYLPYVEETYNLLDRATNLDGRVQDWAKALTRSQRWSDLESLVESIDKLVGGQAAGIIEEKHDEETE